MRGYIFSVISLLLFIIVFVVPVSARSGCCSHHGGVCGCGCCDGSALSSICAPYYPECSGGASQQQTQPIYTVPTDTPYLLPTNTPQPLPTNTPITPPTNTPTFEPITKETNPTQSPTGADLGTSQTNPLSGLITLAIVGGIGYWYFKKKKNKQT